MRQQTLKSMHLAAVLRSPGSHKPNDGVIPEAVPTSDWQIWRGKAGGAIFPCDEWKMLGWDRVLLLLIAYYAFCAPFRTCMDVVASGGWRLFELFGDLFFLADVWLNFRLAYLENNQSIIARHRIASYYVTGSSFGSMPCPPHPSRSSYSYPRLHPRTEM